MVLPDRYFFQYHIQDTVQDIPPLMLLDSKSVKHIKRDKSLLSDLRFLMGILEEEAKRQSLTTVGISGEQEASELFGKIKKGCTSMIQNTKWKDTLKWNTWVSKCRRAGSSSALYVNQAENNEVDINNEEGNQTVKV